MTRPAWRTTYTPGQWLALTGPNTLVVMAPPPARAAATVNELWLSVVGAGSLDALLRLVAEVGLDAMPDLGAFHWDDDGLHGIARGRVKVVDTDSSEVVIDGEGSVTWREEHLGRVRNLGITLEEFDAEETLQLPLVVGAASISALFLTTDPAALVRFSADAESAGAPEPAVVAPVVSPAEADFDHAVPAPGEEDLYEAFETDDGVGGFGSPDSPGEVSLDTPSEDSAAGLAPVDSEGTRDAGVEGGSAGVEQGFSEDRSLDTPSEDSSDRVEQGYSEGTRDAGVEGSAAGVEQGYSEGTRDAGEEPSLDTPSEDTSDRVEHGYSEGTRDAEGEHGFSEGTRDAGVEIDHTMEAGPEEIAAALAGIPAGLPGVPAAPPVAPGLGSPQKAHDIAAAGGPASMSSPGGDRSDPVVIPPNLGEVDDDGGTIFSTGLAATHKPAPPAEERPDPQVLAVPCTNGHANAPGSRTCRICQYPVDSSNPRLIRRPTLAGVHTNRGDFADIIAGVIVGRAPDASKGPTGSYLMRVVSPGNDISRNHVLITTKDWNVYVTDLNSTNGTTVLPDGEAPFTLRDGASVQVGIGTVLDLGDGVSLRIEPPRG